MNKTGISLVRACNILLERGHNIEEVKLWLSKVNKVGTDKDYCYTEDIKIIN